MGAAQGLLRAIETAGSQTALAKQIGVTQQLVSYWVRRRIVPPAEKVLEIERVTGVPRHELRPDLYPPEQARAS